MKLYTLPAKIEDDLNWKEGWKGDERPFLDLGLEVFDPYDRALFHAHCFAVETFIKRFPECSELIFAKITPPFFRHIQDSQSLQDALCQEGGDHELFCAELFSDYLHRLCSYLPDHCTPILMVDLPVVGDQNTHLLSLCLRRFAYMQILFLGGVLPIRGNQPLIVSLPQDKLFELQHFLPLFQRLKGQPYTCIPEELLNEHWEGVETIFVEKKSLGDRGKRMLLGFEAASGEIAYF